MKTLIPLGPGRTLFLLVSLLLLLPVAAGTLRQVSAQSDDAGEDSLYKHLSVFTEVLSLIQRGYVDETSLVRLFDGALEGATDALDPMATYVPAPDVDEYRQALAVGSRYSGLTLAREQGILFVVAVESGSPAAAAEIRAGDIVTKVDDRSTREMALWKVETLLSRETGTVRLELLRQGQSVDTELELRSFERETPSVRVEDGIPVLRIASFVPGTVALVKEILTGEALAGASALVVDIRGVAGGEPTVAYDVAGLFAVGQLGSLSSRGEELETFSSDSEPLWNGRIAVLSDRGSQGAAEIFLASVKDLPAVETVGSRTFGHAGRRASRQLSTGATLFFTDAFYAGSDGKAIDRSLEPENPVRANRLSLGEVEDEPEDQTLRRALELLREQQEQAA